ncbi:MAG: hypothetical protein O3A87_05135 [Verrucomicrobia bacterium]|nr:hypothetical protein [Verrucomicrobiota bacterium]MDA1005850.1 hypothetical protein [Verrucomicrobiota bacterium]
MRPTDVPARDGALSYFSLLPDWPPREPAFRTPLDWAAKLRDMNKPLRTIREIATPKKKMMRRISTA